MSRGIGQNAKCAGICALCILVLGFIAGCRSGRSYALTGRVVAKSVPTQQITVDHKEIPGFMAAMTMPYPVKDPQVVKDVEPGDIISARIFVDKNNYDYWLEHVVIKDKSGRATFVPDASPHELQPGESVPDVPLTDQDGKQIHIDQFKGKAVLVTFIYTRCPFPNFCPLLSNQFAAIDKELAKSPADYGKTQLITITLDPSYDTPPVLRKYGLGYLDNNPKGFEHWDFAATAPSDLQRLATAFGLEYNKQENVINHNMNTTLLAPDGTVAESWSGTAWTVSEIVAEMRKVENASS